jgi:hypothetical protein
MRKHRMFVLGAGLLALALFASACSDSGGDDTGGDSSPSSEPKGNITVGVSGAFAENQRVTASSRTASPRQCPAKTTSRCRIES